MFDHYSRKTGEAFVLEADLTPEGVTGARVTPVYLDASGAPRYVTGSEAAVILERLKTVSARRGTTIEIAGDSATVRP